MLARLSRKIDILLLQPVESELSFHVKVAIARIEGPPRRLAATLIRPPALTMSVRWLVLGLMAERTTNYQGTFIEVSEDCPIEHGVEPPIAENLSIAALHYRLISLEGT